MLLFNQTRYLTRKSIEFQDEGIVYSTGNLLNSQDVFIPYEEIQYERTAREFRTDKFNTWMTAAAAIVAIKSVIGIMDDPNGIYKGLLPFSAILFVVFFIATLLSRKHLLYISTFNSGPIELFDDNPSDVDVDEFLKELKNRTSGYLKIKYAAVDKDLPSDQQLQNLSWLKQRKILSDSEYEHLKGQLTRAKSEIKGFKLD